MSSCARQPARLLANDTVPYLRVSHQLRDFMKHDAHAGHTNAMRHGDHRASLQRGHTGKHEQASVS